MEILLGQGVALLSSGMMKEEPILMGGDMNQVMSEEKIMHSGQTQKFVIFRLEKEEYGLDILKVQEIISYKNVTHLPNVPEHVKGVINLRGNVIPVIDLRLKFGLSAREHDQFTVIIVMEVNKKIIGLIVDTVTEVVNLDPGEVQDTVEMGGAVNTEFIRGMGKIKEQLIILLDIDKVFSAKEIVSLSRKQEEVAV